MKRIKNLINRSGIYALVFEENNTDVICYIGSTGDLESRLSNHMSNLRHQKHNNSCLQSLFNEVGEGRFEFTVLEYCNKSSLLEREDYYKKLHENTICNLNDINNTKKMIRRGKHSANFKNLFSKLNEGEKNPNNRLSEKEAGMILWLKQNTKMKMKDIAEKFKISITHVCNIGVRRWVGVKPVPVEVDAS